MVLYRMLEGMVFDDQSVKAMRIAYEALLLEFQLKERTDPLTEIIASRIIAVCQSGECDPKVLFDLTLREIRE